MSEDVKATEITGVELPIAAFESSIADAVSRQQATIIVAETGAGKSTQVPQYLMRAGYTKVIVTQPRILAARNLSNRVRREWTEFSATNGTVIRETTVAYRTANERNDDVYTKLLFCTDGLQLVRELTGGGIKGRARQILVLDEVHEWNENMEVLIAWAKQRMAKEPDFKIVIMSATIEADRLAQYFETGPPIIVPGRLHSVEKRCGSSVVEELINFIELDATQNILTFLPGKSEIESVRQAIIAAATRRSIEIFDLHSQISLEDQQKVFGHYPNGKIVLSTNIAQTSVTIDDIDVVVDSGLERRIEVQNGVEGLFLAQTSKADCAQRAGRAGRTKPGEYILAPLDGLKCDPLEKRADYPTPEIKRKHIDRLVLRLASNDLDIEALEFYHQPSHGMVKRAKATLKSLGAFDISSQLTSIGRRMEHFPLESRFARMMVAVESEPEPLRRKLSLVIAIQEVGGIVRGGARIIGWRGFTNEDQSDLLAEYDVYLACEALDPTEFEELGIIYKNYERAGHVYERLCHNLGIATILVDGIDSTERTIILRAIVAGQLDQLWTVNTFSQARNIRTDDERELSNGSVVTGEGLVAGQAFDLQVPGTKGISTLHLVESVTRVRGEWLEQLDPDQFKSVTGKLYYDKSHSALAYSQIIRRGREIIDGGGLLVTDNSLHNQRMFTELYIQYIGDKLARQRQQLQASNGRRLPQASLRRLRQEIRPLLAGVISLHKVPLDRRARLHEVSTLKFYIGDKLYAQLEPAVRRHSGRFSKINGTHTHGAFSKNKSKYSKSQPGHKKRSRR